MPAPAIVPVRSYSDPSNWAWAFGLLVPLLIGCSSGDAGSSSSSAGAASVAAAGAVSNGGASGSDASGSASGGAGALGTAGSGGQLPAPTAHSYDADDPNIQYMGRIDWTDPKNPRFASGAVQLTAKFVGTDATLHLLDENRYGNNWNYFEVLVDDAPPVKLKALKTQTSYPIATGLANAEHTITVAKRTEAAVGWAEFQGLELMGELMPPPAKPAHRVEFIGDSISCGSGNEAANESPQCLEDGWGQPYHNGYLAFGPVAARSLGAEYHVTAVSGIGLIRNYSSLYDARPMPEIYDLVFYEEMTSIKWDATSWVPEAIVIELGTNDFSPGDSDRPKMTVDTYTAAYVAFIDQLRSLYPDAHIFGISSPMLGDQWPDPTDMSATDLKTALSSVVDHYAGAGDTKVHKFDVTKLIGTGCGTHPGVAQDASMAAELSAYMKTTLGW